MPEAELQEEVLGLCREIAGEEFYIPQRIRDRTQGGPKINGLHLSLPHPVKNVGELPPCQSKGLAALRRSGFLPYDNIKNGPSAYEALEVEL